MIYILLLIIITFTLLNEYKYKEGEKVNNENVITIKREMKKNGAVMGKLMYKDLNLYTLESEKDKIKEGRYSAFIRESPTNGKVIELEGVPDRQYIQIHVGNYKKNTEGCILVGTGRSLRLPAVWSSNKAMNKLLSNVNEKNLIVEVKEV